MSFDLDRLGFSGSLVGFDDLATDWVGDDLMGGDDGGDGGWVVMMVVMVAVGL